MDLIIAEKPDVARSIAAALGAKWVSDLNAYQTSQYRVIHLHGHVLALKGLRDSDERFQGAWDKDTLALLPVYPHLRDKSMFVPSNKKLLDNAVKHLRDSSLSRVINACDAEREGELLFWEVYDYSGSTKPVFRFWESEYPDKEVVFRGLANLRDESFYGPRKRAAYARQEADWLVGMNLTVGYISATGQKMTVGPVQTPTLALIVDRDRLNEVWQPVHYAEIHAFFPDFKAKFLPEHPYFEDKPYSLSEIDAPVFLEEMLILSTAIVKDIQSSTAKVSPPQLFSLTELQRVASRKYNFSPTKTLEIAQKLYESKVISYPRTDAKVIGETMVHKVTEIAKVLGEHYEFSYGELYFTKRNTNNEALTDHHAIIPLRPLHKDASDSEKQIYELIMRRFFEAFGAEGIDQKKKVTLAAGPYLFEATGRIVAESGWRSFFQDGQDENEQDNEDEGLTPALFKLSKGQGLRFQKSPEIIHKTIDPPPRFTYDSLLAAMENLANLIEDKDLKKQTKEVNGQLGTPATRASIIDMLLERGYIELRKKKIFATELGKIIIQTVAPDIKDFRRRAQMEILLNRFDDPNAIDQYMSDIQELIANNIRYCQALTPEGNKQ